MTAKSRLTVEIDTDCRIRRHWYVVVGGLTCEHCHQVMALEWLYLHFVANGSSAASHIIGVVKKYGFPPPGEGWRRFSPFNFADQYQSVAFVVGTDQRGLGLSIHIHYYRFVGWDWKLNFRVIWKILIKISSSDRYVIRYQAVICLDKLVFCFVLFCPWLIALLFDSLIISRNIIEFRVRAFLKSTRHRYSPASSVDNNSSIRWAGLWIVFI